MIIIVYMERMWSITFLTCYTNIRNRRNVWAFWRKPGDLMLPNRRDQAKFSSFLQGMKKWCYVNQNPYITYIMSVLINVYYGGRLMDDGLLAAWKPVVALTTPTGVIAILIILFICTDESVFCSILNVNKL